MNSKRTSAVARGSGIVTLLAFFATCTLSCGHTRSSAPIYGVSGASSQPRTGPAGADQTFEGIKHDGFELVPSGPGGKPDASQKSVLAFSVTPESGTTVVTISAVNATNLKWALLTLKYDAAKMTPTKVDFGTFLSGDGVLNFSLLSKPGIVPVGICKENCDRVAGVSGSGTLATVTFSNTAFSGKSVSSAPRQGQSGTAWQNRNKVTDLSQPVYSNPGITWSEKLDGDGNLNGEVEISDWLPLANDYGMQTLTSPQVTNVDYDANGEVGISDIIPMAYFFGDTITGYDLYYAQVATGDPAPMHSAMTRLGTTIPDIPRPLTTPAGPLGWYVYYYDLPTAVWDLADSTHDLYVQVVPTGYKTGTSTEEESDAAAVGSSVYMMGRGGFIPTIHLIKGIHLQVNGTNPDLPSPIDVAANSRPTFTLYQVDDYYSDIGITTTRDATAQEKADTTWTTSDATVVPLGTPSTGDQTSPGVTPDWPVTVTIHADYFGNPSTNPAGPPPPGQTHVTAECDVRITSDPNAAAIYDFDPKSVSMAYLQPVMILVKNFSVAAAPTGEVGTMAQQLVLESYPSGRPKWVFPLSATSPAPQQTFSDRVLTVPDPRFPNATDRLMVTLPYLVISPGDYRWRLYNNLGKGSPAAYSHPSSINEPPYDDTFVPPIVTPPGTLFQMLPMDNIYAVTYPFGKVKSDSPEVWIYPHDPIIRKDGDTNDFGVPVNPTWFNTMIKGRNNQGVVTNGQEWTITPPIPAQAGPPPIPAIPGSPTGYWNPGGINMPMLKKSPWALVTTTSVLTGWPTGHTYDYHIIGFGGEQEISTGSITYYSQPGTGGQPAVLRDFGYNPWGQDGLATNPDWSVKAVQLQFEPTIVCKGKGFVPSIQDPPIVALCEDPRGAAVDYYALGRVVLPDNPDYPASSGYLIFTLPSAMNVIPGSYYLQVLNMLPGYANASTIPSTPLTCLP